jgi:23S rRNA (adenine2030-N6)-methyltransferase
MANHHFGEIGDVWKHLPLLEIASIERPSAYWESHAGSAAYAWDKSGARQFGAARFLDLSAHDPSLHEARYTRLLGQALDQEAPVYPGSPRLMLGALASETEFVFCDLDGSSIASIELEAEGAGIRDISMTCVRGDGNRELIDRAMALDIGPAACVLAMLDPFSIETAGEGGVSSLDALHELSLAGVKVLLWWCAKSREEHESRRMLIERATEGCDARTHTVVVGSGADTESIADRYGVWSCAVTLVNMSERSQERCEALGAALARVYSDHADAEAPGLRYESQTHSHNGAAL